MIRAVLITLLLSVSATVEAQLPLSRPEIAADVAKVDRYPAKDVVFPSGIKDIPAAVYSELIDYRPLPLNLYLLVGSAEQPASGFPLVMYIHCNEIAAASPITYVDSNDPQMLLIVGAEDTTVPYQQTLAMTEQLSELVLRPGLNHSFIGKTLGQTRDISLNALEAFTKTVEKKQAAILD